MASHFLGSYHSFFFVDPVAQATSQALTFDDCIQLGLAVPSGVTLACQRKDVARQNIFPAGHRKKANNQQIVNVEAPAGPLVLK